MFVFVYVRVMDMQRSFVCLYTVRVFVVFVVVLVKKFLRQGEVIRLENKKTRLVHDNPTTALHCIAGDLALLPGRSIPSPYSPI